MYIPPSCLTAIDGLADATGGGNVTCNDTPKRAFKDDRADPVYASAPYTRATPIAATTAAYEDALLMTLTRHGASTGDAGNFVNGIATA